MKTFRILIFISIVCLYGCASVNYYQLYNTKSPDLTEADNGLVFENDDVKVVYDLWSNFGNSGFLVSNKTDDEIFIHLGKSYLVINGIAKTYYQNRAYSESSSASLSVGSYYSSTQLRETSSALGSAQYSEGYRTVNASAQASSKTMATVTNSTAKTNTSIAKGFSVTYVEQEIICIPPHCAKIFDGFNINTTLFRNCNMYRFPSPRNVLTESFDEENTPLRFKNIIAYAKDENNFSNLNTIENEFWVSEITNYPNAEFIDERHEEYCGQTTTKHEHFFLHAKPDRFYITYRKRTNDLLKH